MQILLLVALITLVPMTTLADAGPTPAEIKKVLDFYYAEAPSSPVLVEIHVCSEVGTEGEHKNECIETVAADAIEVGKADYLWMNFMVPRQAGDQQLLVQFNHDGVTRLTRQISLSGAIRYRTWKKFELDRPGKWSVKILHDTPQGSAEIEALYLTASPSVITTAAD